MISVDTQKELAGETWDLNRYQAWYEWRDGDTGEAVEDKLRHAYAESLSQDSAVASLRTIRARLPERVIEGLVDLYGVHSPPIPEGPEDIELAARVYTQFVQNPEHVPAVTDFFRVLAEVVWRHTRNLAHTRPELLAGIPAPSKGTLGTFLCSPLLDVIVRQTVPTPDEVTDVESRLVPT